MAVKDVKLFGKQVKPPVAIGLAAGAVFIGVVVIRARKKAASSTSSATSAAGHTGPTPAPARDPYPADGSSGDSADPYSLDPATGQTYGDESYGGSFGGGGFGGGGIYSPPSPPAAGNFTSNAQWSQAAEQYLAGNGGNADTIGNALGKYITGSTVTEAQQTVIESAIAFEGYPPVSGSDGFPPSIRLHHQPTGHPVPGPVPGKPTKAPTGEKAAVSGTSVNLSWDAVKGATGYQLDVHRKSGSGGGKQVTTFGGRVKGESHRLSGLARKADFTWTVAAVDKAGTGPKSPEHMFSTK